MKKLLILACLALLAGCTATTRERVLDSGASAETQLQKRSYQTRVFDTADRPKVIRACISTLQDLGFLVDNADAKLGTVTATKAAKNAFGASVLVRMTLSVRSKGENQVSVRANAQFGIEPMTNPKDYQDFFASLEKSLFLTANAGE